MGLDYKCKDGTNNDRWIVEKMYPGVTDGFYIEAGAATGLDHSASYCLEQLGWSGKSIEANPHFYSEFIRNRKNPCFQGALTAKDGTTEFVVSNNLYYSGVKHNISKWHEKKVYNDGFQIIESPAISVRTLLQDCPKFIHAIMLDIEGSELECLRAFPFDEYQVGCFIIEISDLEIPGLLESHGYVRTTNEFTNVGWEGYFVPRLSI